jgi:hypothetical protein
LDCFRADIFWPLPFGERCDKLAGMWLINNC